MVVATSLLTVGVVGVGWCCGVVGQFEDFLAGFHVVQCLAGPVVGFRGDCVGVFLGVSGRVGPLGEVLAQQAVGVLVGAALPEAVGVAEVRLHVGRGGHACMQGGFGSPVPCQAVARQRGR